MSQFLCELPPTLEYGGNTYLKLSCEQQTAIYEELLGRCHSLDILRREHFFLKDEPLHENVAYKEEVHVEQFMETPKKYPSIERRKVVVLDCEWGQAETRRSQPLSLCAIDLLTGEILINSLVEPSQPMLKWRSQSHGITEEAIRAAAKEHDCLQGWKEARAKLFEFVDERTIIVGHFVHNDLAMLRIFHQLIVDSQVLVVNAAFAKMPKRGGYKQPLEKVCEGFLGITTKQNGTASALENALASREIVLQCIRRPKRLEAWGRRVRIEFWKPKDEEEITSKVNNSGFSGVSLTKQVNASHVSDEKDLSTTKNDGYEVGWQAAYQAGFESGFRTGYDRGCEQTYAQMDLMWTGKEDQDEAPCEDQHNNQELVQETEGEDITSGSTTDHASQNDSDGCDQATEIKGLLAQLMEDDRIKEMVQRVSKKETIANEGGESKSPAVPPKPQALKSRWTNYHGWQPKP